MANVTEKKITKVQRFESILAVEGLNDEQRAFIEKEIELLKKKNSHISKADKAKAEMNDKIKVRIGELVNAGNELFTTTDLANKLSVEFEMIITSQRIAPITNALATEGIIGVDVVKGRKFYKRAV